MNVSIIGTGYVGLVTAVCLAEKGHHVICVDLDKEKVEKINNGIPPLYEEGLEELLQKNVPHRLQATTNLYQSVMQTDISLIAVGTPYKGQSIDLTAVSQAASEVGSVLRDKGNYHLVGIKSTVVPGTTDEVVLPILEKRSHKKAGRNFGVIMNPEFLREGSAIHDFMVPDRIVIGGIDQRSIDMAEELYQKFDDVDLVRTNTKTAEMIKYTSNCFLATTISFSNEIGNLCAAIGEVDVVEVMKAVHLDRRISPIMTNGDRIFPSLTTYLEAGCGFGGSCFPKDLHAIYAHGKKLGKQMDMLGAVIRVNKRQPNEIVALVKKHFPRLQDIQIAVLGLAFKPGTDDVRESPALFIVNCLLREGAIVKAYDPAALDEAKKSFGKKPVVLCESLMQAIDGVEVIIVATRWEEFKAIPSIVAKMRKQPLIIDCRRMLKREGIVKYEGIGL